MSDAAVPFRDPRVEQRDQILRRDLAKRAFDGAARGEFCPYYRRAERVQR